MNKFDFKLKIQKALIQSYFNRFSYLSANNTWFLAWNHFFVLWGVVQGYVVLKTGSIWIAAFMHGVGYSVYSFSHTYLVKPDSKIFSFNLGVYGLICMGIIVIFIFRNPVWKTKDERII